MSPERALEDRHAASGRDHPEDLLFQGGGQVLRLGGGGIFCQRDANTWGRCAMPGLAVHACPAGVHSFIFVRASLRGGAVHIYLRPVGRVQVMLVAFIVAEIISINIS